MDRLFEHVAEKAERAIDDPDARCQYCERAYVPVFGYPGVIVDPSRAANPELAARFPDCPAAKGLDPLSLVKYVADRPGHDRRYAINASKAARELGYEPKVGLDEGLRLAYDWYKQNGYL